MKKLSILLLLTLGIKIAAAAQNIAIGLIVDNKTKLSRSFAFYDYFLQNKFEKNGQQLQPSLADFVYLSDYGIEGIMYENTVRLNIYRKGIKDPNVIKCNNDWETISEAIAAELGKDGFVPPQKFKKIAEGKEQRFYSKTLHENLPGNITIKVPETKLINTKSFKAKINKHKVGDVYEEIKNLYGNFGTSDVSDITVFKVHTVPMDFKSGVKPFVYPISNTMTYSLKMLGYGAVLLEKKDYNAALNCFYTVLNTANGIMCTLKEKAIIKSMAFKNIAEIYSKMEHRQEMAKIFYFGYEMCEAYANSDKAQKDFESYYNAIAQLEQVCKDVELNVQRARGAVFSAAMGAFASSLSSNSSMFGELGVDIFPLANSLSGIEAQGQQQAQEAAAFFEQIKQSKDYIQAESFKVDGIESKKEYDYVSEEMLTLLRADPAAIKQELLDFAKDKSNLSRIVNEFYQYKQNEKDEKEKINMLLDVYKQLYTIELITTTLESKGMKVEERHKSKF
jgi:hypothetical protein